MEQLIRPRLQVKFQPALIRLGPPGFDTADSASMKLKACFNGKHGVQCRSATRLEMPEGTLKKLSIDDQAIATIGTGVHIWINDCRFMGIIRLTDELAAKGWTMPTGFKVVDSDYQGELTVTIRNTVNQTQPILDGEPIAIFMLVPVQPFYMIVLPHFTNEIRED